MQELNIEQFTGFAPNGSYYYSENMRPTVNGVVPGWLMGAAVTTTAAVQWFASGPLGAYALDGSGNFYQQATSWTNVHTAPGSTGNGLIYDQKGRMLYCNNAALGVMTGINTFNDSFKSFTTTGSVTNPCPMEIYEDFILMGRNNNIALLDQSDTLNEQGFTLPANFVVRGIKSNVNGIGIGANFGARSVFFLWDAQAIDSITPWMWFNAPIQTVLAFEDRWIVITSHDIYVTNGYTVTKMPTMPDATLTDNIFSSGPQGALVIDNTLVLGNRSYQLLSTRNKSGFWMMNLPSSGYGTAAEPSLTMGAWNYVPAQGSTGANVTPGAVYLDAYTNGIPSVYSSFTLSPTAGVTYKIGQLSNQATRGVLVTAPFGTGTGLGIAKDVKLALGVEQRIATSYQWTADVVVKVANLNRPLWLQAFQIPLQTTLNVLTIDGSVQQHRAQVGDEVTVLEGVNAGQVRHITGISGQGTTSELWTLDSALPFATEASTTLQAQPFKMVARLTLSDTSNLDDIRFAIRDSIKGRKFMVKLLIENMTGANLPELQSLTFSYDEARQ